MRKKNNSKTMKQVVAPVETKKEEVKTPVASEPKTDVKNEVEKAVEKTTEKVEKADVYKNWYEEICNSFIKFGSKSYNNALCEGINNKIKAIKRSSFGILNFSHLRARVFFLLEI